jgi:hypothetical protein
MAFEIYQTNAREVIEQRFKTTRGQGRKLPEAPIIIPSISPLFLNHKVFAFFFTHRLV